VGRDRLEIGADAIACDDQVEVAGGERERDRIDKARLVESRHSATRVLEERLLPDQRSDALRRAVRSA